MDSFVIFKRNKRNRNKRNRSMATFVVKTGQAYFAPEEGLVKIQARLATIAVIGGSANNASPTLADVIYKLQALP